MQNPDGDKERGIAPCKKKPLNSSKCEPIDAPCLQPINCNMILIVRMIKTLQKNARRNIAEDGSVESLE